MWRFSETVFETCITKGFEWFTVAPRAGAWIETSRWGTDKGALASHPVRVRGLKLVFHAGDLVEVVSHPVRVRGLKPYANIFEPRAAASHPVRVRGLKLNTINKPPVKHWSHPVRVRGLKPGLPGG